MMILIHVLTELVILYYREAKVPGHLNCWENAFLWDERPKK